MSRVRKLPARDHFLALDKTYLDNRIQSIPDTEGHKPRILLLYGSLRERSFSRLATEEAARILEYLGAETRIFDPSDLPLPDQVQGDDHPAIKELRDLAIWSEGQVWCSPERHGTITSVMKAQIDHLPLNMGGIGPPRSLRTALAHGRLGGSFVRQDLLLHAFSHGQVQRVQVTILHRLVVALDRFIQLGQHVFFVCRE